MAFPKFLATGKTLCVRGAPVWPFFAFIGIGVVALPVLALSPLQLVGELLDGGGELRVVAGELADYLDQALDGVVFDVAAIARVSNDSPSFSAISSRTFFSVLLLAMAAFDVRPSSPVASLFSSSTSLIAARKYFLAGDHLRSAAAFCFHASYLVLTSPVAPRCVCTCMPISASLMGISPSAASLWHSSSFLKYMSIRRLSLGGASNSL